MVDRLWAVVRLRLRSVLFSSRMDRELDDEFRDHVEALTGSFIAEGMSPEDARASARRRFGNVDARKDECRDARGVSLIVDFIRDIRYAGRTLSRAPAFSVFAIASLALGIGSTTAVFTLFDAVLLRQLPVAEPDRLRVVHQDLRLGGKTVKSGSNLPYSLYEDLRASPEVFDDVLAFAPLPEARLRVNGKDVIVESALFASDNYFDVLGVSAEHGRVFSALEHADASSVVLSGRFWRRELGARSDVIGQTLRVNDVPFTIIGIAPEAFFGLTIGQRADVYLPLAALGAAHPSRLTLRDRANWYVTIVGRLAGDTSAQAAGERLSARLAQAGIAPPRTELRVHALALDAGLPSLRGRLATPLTVLLAMVTGLLLVACSNVAGLLLARSSARRGEMTMRAALGAGRGRLMRQLLTESAVLAAMAGVVGAVLATWMIHGLLRLAPADTVGALEPSLDARVLVFATFVSLAVAIVAGGLPAVNATRIATAASMRGRHIIGSGGGWLQRGVVIGEVALSLTLVIGAGLLAKTLHRLSTLDPGFDVQEIIAVHVEPGVRQFSTNQLNSYYRELTDRLRAAPGVTSVTLAQFAFLTGAGTTGPVHAAGADSVPVEDQLLDVYHVGADYFTTLGMRVVAGRDFAESDLTGAPVAAINESAARRLFGTQPAIGQVLQSGPRRFEVIAVVQDVRASALRDEPVPTFYAPYPHYLRGRMTFLVRPKGDAALGSIRDRVHAFDSNVPVTVIPLRDLYERNLGQERLLAVLSGAFAFTSLFLLALGVYGALAYGVAQRTREIGVRLALGASRWRVLLTVLTQPLGLLVCGGLVGLIVVLVAGRVIASLLFGMTPTDPLVLGSAMLLLVAVGLAAAVVPAIRASRIDSSVALRCE